MRKTATWPGRVRRKRRQRALLCSAVSISDPLDLNALDPISFYFFAFGHFVSRFYFLAR